MNQLQVQVSVVKEELEDSYWEQLVVLTHLPPLEGFALPSGIRCCCPSDFQSSAGNLFFPLEVFK
jgi:hypothetical protein